MDTALAGTHRNTGWSPAESKKDHRTQANCHKTEETLSVPWDLKRQTKREVWLEDITQMVCKVQSTQHGQWQHCLHHQFDYKDLGWLMKTQLFTINSEG